MQNFIQVNGLQTEKQPLVKIESVLCGDEGEAAFVDKVPALFPSWTIFMQMRNLNCKLLIGPNDTTLINQNHAF